MLKPIKSIVMLTVNELDNLITNNNHFSWEIGGGSSDVTYIMNEVRDDNNKLLHYWVEEIVEDSNTVGFRECFAFMQLESGAWAGHSVYGTFVTIALFLVGDYPDNFKCEPSRRASMDEAEEFWSRMK
jgi:hypothetical protein